MIFVVAFYSTWLELKVEKSFKCTTIRSHRIRTEHFIHSILFLTFNDITTQLFTKVIFLELHFSSPSSPSKRMRPNQLRKKEYRDFSKWNDAIVNIHTYKVDCADDDCIGKKMVRANKIVFAANMFTTHSLHAHGVSPLFLRILCFSDFVLTSARAQQQSSVCVRSVRTHSLVPAGDLLHKLCSIKLQFLFDGHHQYEWERSCIDFIDNSKLVSKNFQNARPPITAKTGMNFQKWRQFQLLLDWIDSMGKNEWKEYEQFSKSTDPFGAVSASSHATELRTRNSNVYTLEMPYNGEEDREKRKKAHESLRI